MPSSLTSRKKAMNKEKSKIKSQKSKVIMIVGLFTIWRIIDFLIIYLAPKFIPYLGFFPYKDQLLNFNLPHWVNSLANFDGLHYLSISHLGYAQYEQAFFPLYPLLIRFLTPVFYNNGLVTGLIISNVSFLLGLCLFAKIAPIENGETNVFFLIIFILVFPTSFFFGAVYTEGLFFFLAVTALYYLKKENYSMAALFAVFTSLTRLIGIFLIFPFIFAIFKKYRISKIGNFLHFILDIKYVALLLSPFIGLGIYGLYLWQTTGDPLYFFSSQPAFGANRSTRLISLPQVVWRYIKIFTTASHNFQYYVSILEFFFFIFVCVILILELAKDFNQHKRVRNYWRLGLGLFSLISILLPTLTGTFLSTPRFALLSLSVFLFLAEIKNSWVKITLAIIFLIFHVALLGLFSQGYFIS